MQSFYKNFLCIYFIKAIKIIYNIQSVKWLKFVEVDEYKNQNYFIIKTFNQNCTQEPILHLFLSSKFIKVYLINCQFLL